ncbi:hypothetical protein O6H91_11G031100 [Diphasiastrum complanatum]|uniref:Uncharacterized protein n=1 Tax=Diphasiastrum complanatum TaxID=34168 RepID=A0ACC2C7N8_DIPCM|nr:hypothetical protein O6H91_11G031100 [Diphasiastrum complanatum]
MEHEIFPENESIEFPLPSCNIRGRVGNCKKSAIGNGHWRSLSAPSDETNSASWDLSPHSLSRLSEEWKQKLRNKNFEERSHALHRRRAALEQDVAELRLRLENEKAVRDTLQRASEPPSSALSPLHHHVNPQATELVTEIATLEGEVVRLEQHVLFLYRKVFDQRSSKIDLPNHPNTSDLTTAQEHPHTWGRLKGAFKLRKSPSPQHRRHVSAAPQRSHPPPESSTSSQVKTRHVSLLGGKCKNDDEDAEAEKKLSNMLQSSVPKETWTYGAEDSNIMDVQRSPIKTLQQVMELQSVGDRNCAPSQSPHLLMKQLYRTPNRLSEELVRCMSAIYCKLSEPPLEQLIDFFQVKGSSDNVGAYGLMVEVPWICVDKNRLAYAAQALQVFRSMVEQLEKVDPGKLREEEKLAFWINVYNALMMHAYLAYGIPRHHLKRISLLQKAAYKIGTYTINANTIEQSILGCRSHRPAQWLQTLLSPLTRFKATEERRAFSLYRLEPLVCFALCCGGRSDPAVRVYSAKSIKKELALAKHDFLRASVGIGNDNKTILLPRILEWYTREIGVGTGNILNWICQNVPEKQGMIKNCLAGKFSNRHGAPCIEWLPYDFSFRYIFTGELALGSPFYIK